MSAYLPTPTSTAPVAEKASMLVPVECWLLTIAAHFWVSNFQIRTTPPAPPWAEAKMHGEPGWYIKKRFTCDAMAEQSHAALTARGRLATN